jgi:catechol 2,3-dioxygenase-like lactoylglutathione lyase family enzyme
MAIVKPAHFSIRTPDLDASERFYTEVLQFRAGFRPPFNFPGAWLYPDKDESEFGAVHLIGADPHSRPGLRNYFGGGHEEEPEGSGSVDHIAFRATDWPATRRRFDALGVPYRVQRMPSLDQIQVFLTDPSGVTIELNFHSSNDDLPKGISQ